VWLALADEYLHSLSIDWEKTKRFTFNEKSNPDDNKLGLQIVKVRSFGIPLFCIFFLDPKSDINQLQNFEIGCWNFHTVEHDSSALIHTCADSSKQLIHL
jgi:hypothetical protein